MKKSVHRNKGDLVGPFDEFEAVQDSLGESYLYSYQTHGAGCVPNIKTKNVTIITGTNSVLLYIEILKCG